MNHKTWQLEKARVPTQGKSGGCLQDPLNSNDNLKESHQLFGQTNVKSAWVTMYFPRWKPNHKQKNKNKNKKNPWQLKSAAVKAWQSVTNLFTQSSPLPIMRVQSTLKAYLVPEKPCLTSKCVIIQISPHPTIQCVFKAKKFHYL